MKLPREIIAAALWVAALALVSFGTIDTTRNGYVSPFMAWGVLLAIIALVPTGWCILQRVTDDREETVEHMIEVIDALHQARSEVSRLH